MREIYTYVLKYKGLCIYGVFEQWKREKYSIKLLLKEFW